MANTIPRKLCRPVWTMPVFFVLACISCLHPAPGRAASASPYLPRGNCNPDMAPQKLRECRQSWLAEDLYSAAWQRSAADVARILPLLDNPRDFFNRYARDALYYPLVWEGQVEIVKSFLQYGADPLVRDGNGKSQLTKLASNGIQLSGTQRARFFEAFRMLIEKADKDGLLTPEFQVPVSVALHGEGSPEMLRLLLEHGADPDRNAASRADRPIAIAMRTSHPELVRLILQYKKNYASAELDAWAYDAFVRKDADLLAALQSAGGNPARHANVESRVLYRADITREECMRSRLERKEETSSAPQLPGNPARINLASCYGLQHGRTDILEACARYDIDFNAECEGPIPSYRRTPLQLAVAQLNARAVSVLVSHGADARKSHLFHSLPVDRCNQPDAFDQCKTVARELASHGADIDDPRSFDGQSAMGPILLWAVRGPYPNSVAVLVESGADVNGKNEGGCTALDEADQSRVPGGQAVVAYLESHGGKRSLSCAFKRKVIFPLIAPFLGNTH